MTVHLPPVIKQLLTLRNPNSASLSAVGLASLRRALVTTYAAAQKLETQNAWLVLTTCTLATLNRPPGIAELYRFATRTDPDDKTTRFNLKEALHRAAVMRESALKGVVFIGVPRTILSLSSMNESFEEDVKSSLRSISVRRATPENIESILASGQALWNSIYAPHEVKLHDKLGSYHPDFISFIIQSYGSVLSPLPEPGPLEKKDVQGNLSRALTSVVGIACLRAEERVGPQLISHVFGLLKARFANQTAEDTWLATDEGAEWVIRTVDQIVDAVASDDCSDGQKTRMTKTKL